MYRGGPMGLQGRRVSVQAFFIVVTLAILSISSYGQPDAGPVPTMSISLDQAQVEAEVTAREGAEVQVPGSVEIDQPQWETSELTLTSVVNTGWSGEIDPNGTQVRGPMTVRFTVTVEVPAGTSSLLTGNVIIRGSLKPPGLSPVVASATAVVTVKQYFVIRLSAAEPMASMERGSGEKIEVDVYNDGNGQDTVQFELIGVPEGIRVSLDTNQVTVGQGEYETIGIDVTTTRDSPAGNHQIDVQATSLESGGAYKVSFTAFARIDTPFDGAPGPALPTVLLAVLAAAVMTRCRGKR